MRVVVIADTHAPRRWRGVPASVEPHLRTADVILHAGDLCTADVVAELAAFAPVHAVLGNNDRPDVDLPETLLMDLDGLTVGMVHDSGPARGRGARLRRLFPTADLVIFGHSHIPLDETVDGLRLLNPGSPTDRRRQPTGTIALLDIAAGRLCSVEIVPV